MDWLFVPGMRATPQKQMAPRNLVVANIQKIYPNGSITYWMRQEEPYLCDLVYVQEYKNTTYVFANPYTGEVQGNANLTFQRFFRDLHYFLFIPAQIGNFTVLLFGFLLFAVLGRKLIDDEFVVKWGVSGHVCY